MAKKPHFQHVPPPGKHPVVSADPSSYYDLKPSWRVAILQVVDPFGWHTATSAELLAIRQRLASFEGMTWAEILVKGKHWNHHVEVRHLCREARDRLEAISQDDVDQLLSLRLTGAGRIWGMLEAGIMKIVWWDPKHVICPSLKK